MQEALTLEVGEISAEFELRDKIAHLEGTGFLTAADRSDWADALAVRRSLLLAGDGGGVSSPSGRTVLDGLAIMLRLQTELIDRRRCLFETEQVIRQQEDAALRLAGIN